MSVDPGSARGRLGGAAGRSCTEQPRAKLAKEASGPESGIVIRGSNKTVLVLGVVRQGLARHDGATCRHRATNRPVIVPVVG